jgi:hypothetical protein
VAVSCVSVESSVPASGLTARENLREERKARDSTRQAEDRHRIGERLAGQVQAQELVMMGDLVGR